MSSVNGIHNLDTNVEQPYVVLPKISLPTVAGQNGYTSIIGRSQICDLSNDLMPRMGVERLMTQQIYRIAEESGPNGEPVFGVIGDKFNQIRCIGGWAVTVSSQGIGVYPTGAGDTLEVSFYGTGLNVLNYDTNDSRNFVYSVDGGADSSSVITATPSGILNSRNYSQNTIRPVVSGLTFGLHTVKIKITVSQPSFFGFEILNTEAALKVPTGTAIVNRQKLANLVSDSVSYNTGFESGVLGTKGGCVVTYLKPDGSIAKAVTPTNTSPAYLTNTDHTNEELTREYNPREFGCGRSDDFSGVVQSGARAFTLDDNLTTLTCSNAYIDAAPGQNGLYLGTTSSFYTFTFVGTGLDIVMVDTASGGNDAHTYSIDGQTAQAWPYTSGSTAQRTLKICSGLPYGTHTFKVTRGTVSTWTVSTLSFKVYSPKKPFIPSGCVELSQYYVLADYVANTVAGLETIGTGLVRKSCTRENVYVGANWVLGIDPTVYVGGIDLSDNFAGQYFEHTFVGTGFELRGRAHTSFTNNATLSIDGSSNFTVSNGSYWTGALSTSYYGGFSIVSSTTGQISQAVSQTLGSGIRVSGLTYGKHTVRLTNVAALSCIVETLDIITPIYFPKQQLAYDTQNTTTIGNCSLGDSRKFQPWTLTTENGKAVYKAVGITVTPTTTSGSYVPVPEMSLEVYSKGGMWDLVSTVTANNNGANTILFRFFVDGVAVPGVDCRAYGTGYQTVPIQTQVYLSKGFHKVDVYWYTGAGTAAAYDVGRTITAKEL